jgi:carbohydrate kinase (thermoresistant glucokinase family)
MGVSGSGKSTVGAALARALSVPFVDADALHPEANRLKMAAGVPLDDADRAPWLDAVAVQLSGGSVVVACSALKRAYRDRLRESAPELALVFLDGTAAQLGPRLAGRAHEYMPVTLLASQLATLEPPADDEHPIRLDVSRPVDELVANAVTRLEQQ